MSRQVEFLCKASDGLLIYVSSAGSYDTFRLWRGDGTAMREEVVVEVRRLRDGGTTIVDTDSGTFWSPSPEQSSDTPPCWVDVTDVPPLREDQYLTVLDPSDFDIDRSGDNVVVAARRRQWGRDTAPARGRAGTVAGQAYRPDAAVSVTARSGAAPE